MSPIVSSRKNLFFHGGADNSGSSIGGGGDDDNTIPVVLESTIDNNNNQQQAHNNNDVLVNNVSSGGENTNSALSKKLSNLKERTIPAIGMIVGLGLIIKYLREKGLIALVFLLQIGLYSEGANVIVESEGTEKSLSSKLLKWWWFLSYNMIVNVPMIIEKTTASAEGDSGITNLLLQLLSSTKASLIGYVMVVLGFVSLILQLNSPLHSLYDFKSSIGDLSSYFMSMVLLLLPSSTWIVTLTKYGLNWVLYPLILVIINDTMAYIFGVSFGKHKLLPSISPKKTYEGFLGAFVSTVALSVWLWEKMLKNGTTIVGDNNSYYHGLIIAVFISILSPFGGFLASTVKRSYGKKDFGNWIQGHGGFVDRLDCQLITAPFIYLYLSQFVTK